MNDGINFINTTDNQDNSNVNNNEEYMELPDWDLLPPFDSLDRGEDDVL